MSVQRPAIGPASFTALLAGPHDGDEPFRTTPLQRDILVLMSLLSVWYNDFLGAQTQAVLPYSHCLALLSGDGEQWQAREHKVCTEATIWDVDSFDQWGVELGKILVKHHQRRADRRAATDAAARRVDQRTDPPLPPRVYAQHLTVST